MKFLEEVVVESFLPTVRSMLATELRAQGLTQTEVADALGISQSAVSKYAAGDVAETDAVREDERVQDLVDRLARGLASEELSRVEAMAEIEVLIRQLEDGDLLARLHTEAMPELSDRAIAQDVHDPDSDLLARERVRSSVRRGLRRLESTPAFATLIPAVGSNLVECLPGATEIAEVAGVPGRIVDVEGRVDIPGDPAFGVSEHVASVLLAAREAGVECGGDPCGGALNVATDRDTLDALEAAGHVTVEYDAAAPLAEAVAEALDREPDATVCYQTGAHGIEPITYLLAADADGVAELACIVASGTRAG
jgi:predicted fused transcriptional regulator/phosphomethylpyrimidine kinase/predicted transcriptional regulator